MTDVRAAILASFAFVPPAPMRTMRQTAALNSRRPPSRDPGHRYWLLRPNSSNALPGMNASRLLFTMVRQLAAFAESSHAHDQVARRIGSGICRGCPSQLRHNGRWRDEVPHRRTDRHGGPSVGAAAMRTHTRCVLMVFALLAPLSGLATTASIYKCVDANLRVLYTDEPCKNGEQLNIRAGNADPAAVAKLQRERDAFDQRAAQRVADQRRQQDWAAQYMFEDYQRAYDVPQYDYGAVWWLPGIARSHPPRARGPKAQESRRLAHMPPPNSAPRR